MSNVSSNSNNNNNSSNNGRNNNSNNLSHKYQRLTLKSLNPWLANEIKNTPDTELNPTLLQNTQNLLLKIG